MLEFEKVFPYVGGPVSADPRHGEGLTIARTRMQHGREHIWRKSPENVYAGEKKVFDSLKLEDLLVGRIDCVCDVVAGVDWFDSHLGSIAIGR